MHRYKFKSKTHCLRGHPRTPENVYKNRCCKICHSKANKEWWSTHEHKSKRNTARNSKLGWNAELYRVTKHKQKNRCAICRVKFKYSDENTNACRDHKHGKVPKPRGLLCHCCNLLIGNAKESIKTLIAAIFYLKKYS